MENYVFLTLLYKGDIIETAICQKEKLNSASECLIADNKWRSRNVNDFELYVNETTLSISGLVVKGDFIEKYNINDWF